MLRPVNVNPRTFIAKALFFNVAIALFVTLVLMMRADALSWMEFRIILYHSVIYTFACGSVTSAAFYFGQRLFIGYRTVARLLIVLSVCILTGALGHFTGSSIIALFRLRGLAVSLPADASFVARVGATWIYAPLMIALTATFGLAIYGFEMLLSNLEETAGRLKEKELQEERLLKLKAEAELKALQARINPHFLFNTLNSIASLIAEDPAKAEEMTEKLSVLFRYTLAANRRESVGLEQELHIVRSYLDIERLRLGERMRVSIEMEDGLQELSIPPLLLQPLVENSVKYAVAPREEGGNIWISARRIGNRCLMEVADDGPGFAGDSIGSGHGLENIRQRLAMTYGDAHRFSIICSGNRTAVQIEIPISSTIVE